MKRFFVLAMLTWLPLSAMAEDKSTEVMVRWNDIVVTQEDMERYLAFHLPDEDPAMLIGTRFDQYVRNMLMMRQLAQRAMDEGAGPDAEQLAWQSEYQQVTWLVQAYQRQAVEEALADVDLESYSREIYIAEPERFVRADRVNAAHILLKTEDRSEDEALELIKQLREKALAGEEFSALAREHSDDRATARKGGELGEFEASKMVPEFSAAAFALEQPGEISEPIKTQFGYHIIKLNEKIAGSKRSFESVKSHLMDEIRQSIAKQTINSMLGTLRGETLEAEMNYKAINALRAKYNLEPVTDIKYQPIEQEQ